MMCGRECEGVPAKHSLLNFENSLKHQKPSEKISFW